LYRREIYGGKDVYIEFCDRDYIPQDPERTLWKWIFNPEFMTEYPKSDPHPTSGDQMYLIPISELVNISRLHYPERPLPQPTVAQLDISPKVESKEEEVPTQPSLEPVSESESDEPASNLTIRDYAAIHWMKPVSVKPWLNELINKTFKE
jgi:hypothetical protein